MKKIITILTVILLLSAAGCTSSSSGQSPSGGAFLKPFDTSATINETVLVDRDGVVITAKSIDYTDYQIEVNIAIKNDSSKNIEVSSNTMASAWNAVNDTMITDGWIYEEVLIGETVETSMDFSYRMLELYGINGIAEMTLSFLVGDMDSYDTLFTADGILETSLKNDYEYGADHYQNAITSNNMASKNEYTVEHFSNEEIFNVSDVQISSVVVAKNSSGSTALFLEFNNNSANDFIARIYNPKINDTSMYGYQWSNINIAAQKKAIMDIDLSYMLEQLEDSPLANPENISSFSFELAFDDRNTSQEVYRQELTISLPNIAVGFEVEE